MAARRQDLSQFSSKSRFTSLKTVRWLSQPGQSLFWLPRPQHFPLQEMLSGRMANRYSNKGL